MVADAYNYTEDPEEYDRYAHLVNSRYLEAHAIQNEIVIEALVAQSDKSKIVMDLGCGTGFDAVALLHGDANLKYVGVDQSQQMCERLMKKVGDAGFGHRTTVIQESIQRISHDSDTSNLRVGQESFRPQVVITAFTCHHLKKGEKASLYRAIAKSLPPTGFFVITDLINSEVDLKANMEVAGNEALLFEIADIRKGAELASWLDDEEREQLAQRWVDHYTSENIPLQLSEEIALLKESGFSQIQLHFRSGQNCVLSAGFGSRFDDYSRLIGRLHEQLDQISIDNCSSDERDTRYEELFQRDKKLRRDFYRSFGISGASFAIADNQTGGFTLLQQGVKLTVPLKAKFAMPIVKPPSSAGLLRNVFLGGDDKAIENYSGFINRLFQIERGRQVDAGHSEVIVPEFLRVLEDGIVKKSVRNKTAVRQDWHLYSESELLLAIVEWRWYLWMISRYSTELAISNLTFDSCYQASPAGNEERYFDDKFFQAHKGINWRDLPEASIALLDKKDSWGGADVYHKAWEALRMQLDDSSTKTCFGDDIECIARIAGRVPQLLAEQVFEIIQGKHGQSRLKSIRDALVDLHKLAEAPICPYYYFILSDGRLKSHFVTSLLRSETNPVTYYASNKHGRQQHTVVALALVSLDSGALGYEVATPSDKSLQLFQLRTALGICANRMIDRLFVDRLHLEARHKVRSHNDKVVVASQVTSKTRIFVLGSFDRRITFYSQQARALQLVRALTDMKILDIVATAETNSKIAVVGGGIAGVTAAAALLLTGRNVTLFERREILHLQSSASHRFVLPRVAEWPDDVSLCERAQLPLLDWKASTASEIVGELTQKWRELLSWVPATSYKIESHCEIIEVRQNDKNPAEVIFLRNSEKLSEVFDVVIMAVGHGFEEGTDKRRDVKTYWEQDGLTHPVRESDSIKVIIAGTGDGGLVDFQRVATGKPEGSAEEQRKHIYKLAQNPALRSLGRKFREIDFVVAAKELMGIEPDDHQTLPVEYMKAFETLPPLDQEELLSMPELSWRPGVESITLVHNSPQYLNLRSLLFNRVIVFLLAKREPGRIQLKRGKAAEHTTQVRGKKHVKITLHDGTIENLPCDEFVARQGVPRKNIFAKINGLKEVHLNWEKKVSAFGIASDLDQDTFNWYAERVFAGSSV